MKRVKTVRPTRQRLFWQLPKHAEFTRDGAKLVKIADREALTANGQRVSLRVSELVTVRR